MADVCKTPVYSERDAISTGPSLIHFIDELGSALTVETEHRSTASAAEKLFAIPELLEIILIELSFIYVKSVFAVQRVNTAFNDTINTTPKIRRNICLDPLLEREEETEEEVDAEEVSRSRVFFSK